MKSHKLRCSCGTLHRILLKPQRKSKATAGRKSSRSHTMVRAYTQEHVYHHPWDRVTAAAYRKFTDPSTPVLLSHITDVHTLSRNLDSHRGILTTTRSITIKSPPLPFILRRLLSSSTSSSSVICHCVESTVVDANSRTMDIVARNVSLRSLIEVEERSRYVPHPEEKKWTLFRQETSIRCRPLSAIAAVAEKVEARCAERFLQNSAKGRDVVERICKYLEAESAVTRTGAVEANAAASG